MVFIEAVALGTGCGFVGEGGPVSEGADMAFGPGEEFPFFRAAAEEFVTDPCGDDACEKNEEGCKDKPWEGEADHGVAPDRISTMPHAVPCSEEGANCIDRMVFMRRVSVAESPVERVGTMWTTVPGGEIPTRNAAWPVGSGGRAMPWRRSGVAREARLPER